MNKTLHAALVTFVMLVAYPAHAQVMSPDTLNPTTPNASSHISIDKAGNVLVENLKVVQIAGKSLFTRAMWGQSFLRVLVRTTDATKLMRLDGTTISVKDINLGDLLNVKGVLDSGGDSFSVNAAALKDTSLQQHDNALTGTVTGLATTSTAFTLLTPDRRSIEVHIGTSTSITKGSLTISAADITIGSTVISAVGLHDPVTNILQATRIVVYIDMSRFKAQNFEGTLKSLDASARTLEVAIKGVTYTVHLTEDAKILNKKRAPANLARFIVGDTVRCYGAVQEADTSVIEATVLRNVNL